MNKKVIVAAFVFIALFLFAAALFMMSSKKSAPSTSSTSTQVTPIPSPKTLSVAELFQKAMTSGSLKCTFSSESVTGTSYIKNGMINFTATTNAPKKVVVHSVMKNKTLWTWNEGETKGMMMDMSQLDVKTTPAAGTTSPEDIQKQIEANKPNCTQESIDDSMFEVPKNVTFTDLTKMMKSIPKVSLPAGYKMPSGIPTQ